MKLWAVVENDKPLVCIEMYRHAQLARMKRISAWARDTLSVSVVRTFGASRGVN